MFGNSLREYVGDKTMRPRLVQGTRQLVQDVEVVDHAATPCKVIHDKQLADYYLSLIPADKLMPIREQVKPQSFTQFREASLRAAEKRRKAP